MKLGDLVRCKDSNWLIVRYDPNVRAGVGMDHTRKTMEIVDEPELEVICNPAEDWNLLSLPVFKWHVNRVTLPKIQGESVELQPWVDWILSDPGRKGGSILIKPTRLLRVGDVIVVSSDTVAFYRMTIPRFFGSVAHRKKMAEQALINPSAHLGPPPPVATRFTHMMKDDDE